MSCGGCNVTVIGSLGGVLDVINAPPDVNPSVVALSTQINPFWTGQHFFNAPTSFQLGTSGAYGGQRSRQSSSVSATGIGNAGVLDTLMSSTLLANSLVYGGESIHVKAFGRFAANANAKRVKISIGGIVLHDASTNANGESFVLDGTLSFLSPTTFVWGGCFFNTTSPVLGSVVPSTVFDPTINNPISFEAGGPSAGDVKAFGLLVEYSL